MDLADLSDPGIRSFDPHTDLGRLADADVSSLGAPARGMKLFILDFGLEWDDLLSNPKSAIPNPKSFSTRFDKRYAWAGSAVSRLCPMRPLCRTPDCG
jgi:hypothetical protein